MIPKLGKFLIFVSLMCYSLSAVLYGYLIVRLLLDRR